MSGFMAGFFDRIGDVADGITGRAGAKNYQAQLEAQRQQNASVFQMEHDRLAQQQTPEYRNEERNKLYVAVGVFLACLVLAFMLLRNK